MLISTDSHPKIWVNEVQADIDVQLVDLIRHLNTPDHKFYTPTSNCCQGNGMAKAVFPWGYIMFTKTIDSNHPLMQQLQHYFLVKPMIHTGVISPGAIYCSTTKHPDYGHPTTIRWVSSGMCNLLTNVLCNPIFTPMS